MKGRGCGSGQEKAGRFSGTTILAVRHKGKVAMGGDGQVSFGETIMKRRAHKIRRVHDGRIIVGIAGAAADAFALLSRLEGKLQEHQGNLPRAAVELAKEWRLDRVLRRLEALLAVVGEEHSFIISGTGDVIEPDEGIIGIGSGGPYAAAAAKALVAHTDMDAESIVREAMRIAASICVHTNDEITVEVL